MQRDIISLSEIRESDFLKLELLFDLTSSDINCNTSYPVQADYFSEYRTNVDIMDDTKELSFYYHIPFCKHLCSFCEYTRFLCGDVSTQKYYVDKLITQSQKFMASHHIDKIHGLDIGGGTPTSLDIHQLERLIDHTASVCGKYPHDENFEPSIEFSFSAIDKEKIRCIADHNIPRVSTGIQIYDKELIEKMNRKDFRLEQMLKWIELIKTSGIKKLNLDLMYGFEGQTDTVIKNTLYVIKMLMPEQVTLYEMRYNRSNFEHSCIDREMLFRQYEMLYDGIIASGYNGNFGQNTFSLSDDEGVSSYLFSRMFYGIPYKGFGISAQSMSHKGISYNILKSCKSQELPMFDDITEQDVYLLPKEEIAAKYVCVALYSGRFSLNVLRSILNCDPMQFYRNEFEFLLGHGYITANDDICKLTRNGFKLYGAVASLFWSGKHKEKYIKDRTENKI